MFKSSLQDGGGGGHATHEVHHTARGRANDHEPSIIDFSLGFILEVRVRGLDDDDDGGSNIPLDLIGDDVSCWLF